MTDPYDVNIDLTLFSQIAKADDIAFAALFNRYKEKVYAVAKQVLKESYLAEEVVQDVFTNLWINRKELTVILNPSSYLFRITRNRSIDMLRRQSTQERVKQEIWKSLEESQSLDVLIHSSELEKLIVQAIDQLPPKRKEIFLLSRQTELSYEEIAVKTGISKNTVKTHLLIAVREIRDFLKLHRYLYWALPVLNFFL